MRTISISHCADIDGIGSVAMLLTKYEIKSSDIFLIDYSDGAIKRVERAIRKGKPKDTNLFITDLNANDSKIGTFLSIIRTVKRGGGHVFWFDHHPWSKKAVGAIAPECDKIICGERNECATDITIRQLGLKSKFVKEFRRVCHISDLALPQRGRRTKQLIKTYAMGIASYNTRPESQSQRRLVALAKALASGRFTNGDVTAEARRFDEISRKRIREMVKDLSLVGDKIAVGFAKSLQSTNACYHIMGASGREIGIFINVDAKRGNLRSKKTNITNLAGAFGGGGHPCASGFSFGNRYDVSTKKGRLKLLDKIDTAAAKLKI